MLELQGITKSYTTGNFTQTALDGVSIAFRNCEFVAILGPSGSGKTTMLNIIGGLDRYDAGDLIIDGVSTKNYRDADWDAYRNNQVGFVFQAYNLIPHQTVLANVEMALTLSGVSPAERKARAREALRNVGLEQHADKKPNQLSGGQAQRVAIARALVNNPTILLADEPTGALDSKTSVEVMNLLTEIAADRLVVMVTHNPELAEQYANRIVRVHDGTIEDDTNPFDPATEEMPEAKPVRRTAMSYFTALALSAKNLMTKLGRTIMTAFAGSIGIIGIALILSLATGANNYIKKTEEETLSEYPLTIMSSGFSFAAMFADTSSETTTADSAPAGEGSEDSVRVMKAFTTFARGVGSNDLAALKVFLDSNDGNIRDYVSSIEYTYSVTPLIFALYDGTTWQQSNPDTSISAYTTSAYSSSFMSAMYSSDVFYEMPTDATLYENSYTVMAGRWPEAWNEMVLVVTAGGYIPDYMLYNLGLRDAAELSGMVDSVMNGQEAGSPTDIEAQSFDAIMGVAFKLVNVADTYAYDETYGIWMDKSEDAAFMAPIIEGGEDLRIVGIVKPASADSVAMLSNGVNYLPALTAHIVEVAAQSDLVKAQLADPEVDVLTGKPFDEAEGSSIDLAEMFSVDEAGFASAFSVDTRAIHFDISGINAVLSEENLTAIMKKYLTPEKIQELKDAQQQDESNEANAVMRDAWQLYLERYEEDNSITPDEFFGEGGEGYLYIQEHMEGVSDEVSSAMAEIMRDVATEAMAEVSAQVAEAMQRSIAGMVASLPGAIRIDADKLASSFQVSLTESDLMDIMQALTMSGMRSYENNLSTLNYADLNTPTQIDIYPKDFESKEAVIRILNEYNAEMEQTDKDKVVTFTDLVGTLMSSVTDIIDVISYLLIAFVSISLIVSSIMIGIITYISVLERKKEIGILRAIGARKRDISRVFNAETFIEGFIAGTLGVVVTLLINLPINAIVSNLFDVQGIAYLPPTAAVALICISVFLTFISGLIPSRAAAKADPVVALRSE